MNWTRLWELASTRLPICLWQHLIIVVLTVTIAIFITLPLGIFLTRPRFKRFSNPVIAVINVLQTIPSLTLIALTMPILGIGMKPTIMILSLMSLMPILKNFITGVNGVDIGIIEAAHGMGMTRRGIFFEVEIPLAMPVIMTGIRTTTVLVIASATLAAMIGAGGLGILIFLGLAMGWSEALLLGGISCAVLASLADYFMGKFAMKFVPPGMIVEEY